MSLTPITNHSLIDTDTSENEEDTDAPDITNESQLNTEEEDKVNLVTDEEKIENTPQEVSNVNVKLEETDKKEYYMRIARTLLIILAVILVIYFINWILKNIFKIDLYQLAKDKVLSLPIIGGIGASIASSTLFGKSSSDSNSSPVAENISPVAENISLQPTENGNAPVSFDENMNDGLPNNDVNLQTDENIIDSDEQQDVSTIENNMSGSEMKQVLSESIEKSLVNLLSQFK